MTFDTWLFKHIRFEEKIFKSIFGILYLNFLMPIISIGPEFPSKLIVIVGVLCFLVKSINIRSLTNYLINRSCDFESLG
jgi:hypothetical protein